MPVESVYITLQLKKMHAKRFFKKGTDINLCTRKMSTCEGTFNHGLLNLQIHGCPWTVKAGNKCCQYGNAHVFHIYNLPHTTWTQPFPLTSFSLEPQVIQMSIMKQTSIIQWFYQVSSRDFGAMLSEVVLMLAFFLRSQWSFRNHEGYRQ